MKNPMMPFGEEPSTLSLDMPPGLTSIMQMASPSQSRPTGITANLGIGPEAIGATQQGIPIPSFQKGGQIPGVVSERQSEILNQSKGTSQFADIMQRNFGTPAGLARNLAPVVGGALAGPLGGAIVGGLAQNFIPAPQSASDRAIRNYSDPFGMGPGIPFSEAAAQSSAPPETPPFVDGDTSYAEGGMVGMEGMRVPPGAVPGMPMQAGVNPEMQTGTPMNPQMLEMQINQFVNRNPQQVAMIRQSILEELQTGELTPQELNMIVQLATVAAQNPEMYSYVRNFAIQQGIASEDDLPAQYDQGLVFVLLLAARAVQQDLGGAPVGMGQAPGSAAPVVPSMAKGGKIASSGESKPVIIEAHTGEYVIPKHVVDMKGKEFFDSLVEKYKDQK